MVAMEGDLSDGRLVRIEQERETAAKTHVRVIEGGWSEYQQLALLLSLSALNRCSASNVARARLEGILACGRPRLTLAAIDTSVDTASLRGNTACKHCFTQTLQLLEY